VPKCKTLLTKLASELTNGRIAISGQLIGGDQTTAVVQSCMHSSFGGIIDSLDLSDNDVRDPVAADVIDAWHSSIRELDLSGETRRGGEEKGARTPHARTLLPRCVIVAPWFQQQQQRFFCLSVCPFCDIFSCKRCRPQATPSVPRRRRLWCGRWVRRARSCRS
jgi:hypothetical protein